MAAPKPAAAPRPDSAPARQPAQSAASKPPVLVCSMCGASSRDAPFTVIDPAYGNLCQPCTADCIRSFVCNCVC